MTRLPAFATDAIPEGVAVKTKPRMDRAHPLKTQGDKDPALRQLSNDVRCKVKMTVSFDGSLDQFSIAESTGIPEIDQLCLNAFVEGRLLPATKTACPYQRRRR